MSKHITIPDDLVELLERQRQAEGLPSVDATAERLLRTQLEKYSVSPYSVAELRSLIDEADASGPAEAWDASAVRAEVLRRHAARKAG